MPANLHDTVYLMNKSGRIKKMKEEQKIQRLLELLDKLDISVIFQLIMLLQY